MLSNACHTVTWAQLQNGFQHALLDLYNQHYIGLINYGIKLTGNRELSADCITQVLLRLWDSRSKLPVVENVRSYLLTCLRREIMAEIKFDNNRVKKNAIYLKSISEEEFSYEEWLVQVQHNRELGERLSRAMQSLTHRERELLKLKFFEDLDYDEIAIQCSITKRTAYNIVHHALKTLKEALLDTYSPNEKVILHPAILASLICFLIV